ncbi:MAG: NAD(+)/NADH kinase [Bacteroidales bacterium]|nr:NAD(+)/NADH kinase [Bacteroidales bacterium]
MKAAYYIKKDRLHDDPRFISLKQQLEEDGLECYEVKATADLQPSTGMLLSIGGDGTFLSAATIAAPAGIPVVGVNMGRVGFLSANQPDEVAPLIKSGEYLLEERSVLEASVHGLGPIDNPFAFNEVCVSRLGAAMLGVDVTVDGVPLPTYWADGLLVATSTGSTAYSLSVGGPICHPASRVLIIAPISPHNLNLRPLVVPDTAKVEIVVHSRDAKVRMTMDNRNMEVEQGARITVQMAQFSLKMLRPSKSNFIEALKSKLFWGEDVRNL